MFRLTKNLISVSRNSGLQYKLINNNKNNIIIHNNNNNNNLLKQLKRFNSTTTTKTIKPIKKIKEPRFKKYSRRLLILSSLGFIGYYYDTKFCGSAVTRNIRSLITFITISIDYKLNFVENYDIESLHERNSQRLYDLLMINKGLYIKFGQMIAIQGEMFPKQYQDKFKKMFDSANADDWNDINSILIEQLGENYIEFFQEIDKTPIASASIAQVHKAVLKNGDKVALKVQHIEIQKQMWLDLLNYRYLMKFYEWFFEIPFGITVDYICDKLKEEADFTIEMKNGELLDSYLKNDSELNKNIYIPKYYKNLTKKKVLVTEWIDGYSLAEYENLSKKGFNLTQLAYLIFKFHARQVFSWGVVHCDPHPGNMIVRFKDNSNNNGTTNTTTIFDWFTFNNNKKTTEIVLLDHGLFETYGDTFRIEYASFWKAFMEADTKKLIEITENWGFGSSEMFVGMMSSSNPHDSKEFKKQMEEMKNKSYFEKQKLIKERMKNFLKNTEKFPMALTFISRSGRIIQGVNKKLGAPVNRINIMADEAIRAISIHNSNIIKNYSLKDRLNLINRYLIYNFIKSLTSLIFILSKLRVSIYHIIFPNYKVRNIEEIISDSTEEMNDILN
ncbi:transferase activity, transferring phosphorus-containing groups protein [[Candida] boidinii]|nr:transferase activity, transferring phosphorus-containing groups protein [[Candida] boidinii]